MQEFFIRGNIAHGRAVMSITNVTLLINDADQWHPPEFEQINFLPIHLRNGVCRVRQADKGNLLVSPITLKDFTRRRSDGEDFRTTRRELVVASSQARQRRAAVRSHEPAQEVQHDNFVSAKI